MASGRRYQPRPYDGVVRTDLAAALAPRLDVDPRPRPQRGDRLAAVLAVIVEREEPALLFTERAAAMTRHAGEVSFPGGLQDPGDQSLRATALRETLEEVGIEPEQVRVLGALSPVHTFVSGILVTPFVGVVASLPPLVVSEAEIARVLDMPMRALADAEEQRVLREEGGGAWRGWWYPMPEATVWGATGFMVHELLELVRKEAPWVVT
jgi:8-oxo-dGTP pyrophosphatase MutT (NUDIX family)